MLGKSWLISSILLRLSQKWAYFNCKLMLQKLHFVLKSFLGELLMESLKKPNFFSRAATHVAAVVISPAHDTSLSGNENGCDRENAHLTSIYGP